MATTGSQVRERLARELARFPESQQKICIPVIIRDKIAQKPVVNNIQ
jgi:hypothetical protein